MKAIIPGILNINHKNNSEGEDGGGIDTLGADSIPLTGESFLRDGCFHPFSFKGRLLSSDIVKTTKVT